MAKHLREKTFTFRVENGYSLENFCSSILVDLHCQSTRPYFVGTDLQLSENSKNHPLEHFTVHGICLIAALLL